MKVAVVQHNITWCDRETNFARLAPMIGDAASAGARLVVLTETFATGFAVEDASIAEEVGGPSSSFLASMAQTHNVWVAGSCLESADGGDGAPMVNSLVVANPQGLQYRYHKIHPFTFGGEATHVRAGQDFLTLNIEGVRTSLFVCYDLRFADEFWKLAPETDLYLVPANWPIKRQSHWSALLRARAIENQAYVVGCNRVGEGRAVAYGGESMILDPWGADLAVAANDECIIYGEIDPGVVADTRAKFPFIQDRR
ncbi:MAG: carbon-nitrogen family hydrolase [Actinobacteria bacterium]|jgi:predicted amidohydrolase|nr:carbon-nitrogen family hydrolase [Actinomycetota bacterium]